MANLNSSIQVYDLDRDPHQAVLEAVAAAVGTEMADRTAISAASCRSSADRSAMKAPMAMSTGISQTAGTALTAMAARGAPIAMSTGISQTAGTALTARAAGVSPCAGVYGDCCVDNTFSADMAAEIIVNDDAGDETQISFGKDADMGMTSSAYMETAASVTAGGPLGSCGGAAAKHAQSLQGMQECACPPLFKFGMDSMDNLHQQAETLSSQLGHDRYAHEQDTYISCGSPEASSGCSPLHKYGMEGAGGSSGAAQQYGDSDSGQNHYYAGDQRNYERNNSWKGSNSQAYGRNGSSGGYERRYGRGRNWQGAGRGRSNDRGSWGGPGQNDRNYERSGNYGDREKPDLVFEIVKCFGFLSANQNTGWRNELCLVSWNNNAPKYDLRVWSDDHSHMKKGVTLRKNEAARLIMLLEDAVQYDPELRQELEHERSMIARFSSAHGDGCDSVMGDQSEECSAADSSGPALSAPEDDAAKEAAAQSASAMASSAQSQNTPAQAQSTSAQTQNTSALAQSTYSQANGPTDQPSGSGLSSAFMTGAGADSGSSPWSSPSPADTSSSDTISYMQGMSISDVQSKLSSGLSSSRTASGSAGNAAGASGAKQANRKPKSSTKDQNMDEVPPAGSADSSAYVSSINFDDSQKEEEYEEFF
ncbi:MULTISPECIES: PC4/YdbC family ssDNA-binding protein [unclassified Anaerobiospirillum]|uniref:YdbC family protein n=1 Tax=unclassified Anaerobiospirillum TaxID=2647410 RepID=UPI001FF6C0E8|nr:MULTISPECIES: PC4/YdbC family ssDNA-binding protein [unclassified Anaerobiospirillum]MCK0534011.1 PC4/YdbC family ssDNA-binding protein [Anaerobiospirillum sp. NML120511]MCK0539246.1 PC4/YdbC family ssDNA-binding protein [Anaerobiospirillum sp. NML02-A-032]